MVSFNIFNPQVGHVINYDLYGRFLEVHGSQSFVRSIEDCSSDEIIIPIEIIERLYDGTVTPKGNGYCREYVNLFARREREQQTSRQQAQRFTPRSSSTFFSIRFTDAILTEEGETT
jgi:hypothetical protein